MAPSEVGRLFYVGELHQCGWTDVSPYGKARLCVKFTVRIAPGPDVVLDCGKCGAYVARVGVRSNALLSGCFLFVTVVVVFVLSCRLLPRDALQLILATLDGCRPKRYGVWVSKMAKVGNLVAALSRACGVREDRLALADVWQHKLQSVYQVW